MGAVFAIQVRTGQEIKAKEMLKHVFVNAGESLVKGIYALETHTEFINNNRDDVNLEFEITEQDIATHLSKERYRTAISNKRAQLKAIERYESKEYIEIKRQYRNEIYELERKLLNLRVKSKHLHSVLKGYLLIELHWNSTYMPNHLWHLIKSVPLVQNILSEFPIPKEEFNQFISNLDSALEPEVIISIDKENDVERTEEIVKDLLTEANAKSTKEKRKEEIFKQIDDLYYCAAEKIRSIISNTSNNLLKKIKIYISRGYETISMPISLLNKVYKPVEIKELSKGLDKKDLVSKIQSLSSPREVCS